MEKCPARGDSTATMGDRVFKGVGDLIKLLPSGMVFLFQFLSPLLTNNGHCHPLNSYVGGDGKVYYGIVTRSGLCPFSGLDAGDVDLSRYKLRAGDFAHAFVSLAVFAVVAVLDSNTVGCFFPSFEAGERTLLVAVPAVVGVLASSVFVVFPNDRHGIGYPATQSAAGY